MIDHDSINVDQNKFRIKIQILKDIYRLTISF